MERIRDDHTSSGRVLIKQALSRGLIYLKLYKYSKIDYICEYEERL